MNHENLLSLLKEHLDKLSPEDLAKQLFDCKADGPTLDEFFGSDIVYVDFYDDAYSTPFYHDFDKVIVVAANDEQYDFSLALEYQYYDTAA